MSGAAKKRKGLGRGLGALISSKPVKVKAEGGKSTGKASSGKAKGAKGNVVPLSAQTKQVDETKETTQSVSGDLVSGDGETAAHFVPISSVAANPDQPRKRFAQAEVQELIESIKTLGVLQPVLVRPIKGKKDISYQVVAGERRWRAAKAAGLTQLPVIIKELDDRACLEVALVENIQRSDLTPLEEARGYDELMKKFSLTQIEVAERVGKDRASIANAVRLLKLPVEVQAFVESKALSVGHAKAILTVKEPKLRVALAHKVIKERLTVRDLEKIVSRQVELQGGSGRSKTKQRPGSPRVHSELAQELQNTLGTKVRIAEQPSGRGKITIEYFSSEELERVVDIICEK